MDIGKVNTIEELFRKWKEAHLTEKDLNYLGTNIPKGMFLEDGIIDADQFETAETKVLFLAKEANWHHANIEDSENIQSMFWHQEVAFGRVPETLFSKRLSMLANGILSADINNYKIMDKSHAVLQKTAVVNLNKRGGYANCIWDTLHRYVQVYQDYIRQQICLTAPNLIVCCGYDVKWLIDEYRLAPENCRVIWLYHPSYFAISDTDYLEQLKCAMRGEVWRRPVEQNAVMAAKSDVKGIIFDTNKTYSSIATMDMLLCNKVSAYGEATHLINSFNMGDYVFFSVKGSGIVAAGRIISEAEDGMKNNLCERYKVVEFVVPTAEQMPHGEEELKALSWHSIRSLLGHGFYHARTDKRPYLTEAECDILCRELQVLNSI